MNLTSEQKMALRQAAEWLSRCQAQPNNAQLSNECTTWQLASEVNSWAWAQVAQLKNQFSVLPKYLSPQTLQQSISSSRRHFVKSAVLLGAVASTAWYGYAKAPIWLASYRTHVGEQRQYTLEDGTVMVLNTQTAVNINFSAHRREVQLITGEIYVETAKDARPFYVNNTHGKMQALGTAFNVRQFDDATSINVYQGAVQVCARLGSWQKTVNEGNSMRFNQYEMFSREKHTAQVNAWIDQQIIIDDWPLSQLLTELDRYYSGTINVDRELESLRISGTFFLDDWDTTFALIEQALPVKVKYFTRYWVSVSAA